MPQHINLQDELKTGILTGIRVSGPGSRLLSLIVTKRQAIIDPRICITCRDEVYQLSAVCCALHDCSWWC